MAAWLEVLPGFEEGLPLDSLAEECDHPGRFGGLGRLGLAPAGQDGAHDPVGGHTARQGAPAVGCRAARARIISEALNQRKLPGAAEEVGCAIFCAHPW